MLQTGWICSLNVCFYGHGSSRISAAKFLEFQSGACAVTPSNLDGGSVLPPLFLDYGRADRMIRKVQMCSSNFFVCGPGSSRFRAAKRYERLGFVLFNLGVGRSGGWRGGGRNEHISAQQSLEQVHTLASSIYRLFIFYSDSIHRLFQ
jgi:hypothetical protein